MNHYYNKGIYFILLPYLWLGLFLFVPFVLILMLSISEYAAMLPPFKFFIDVDSNNKLAFSYTFENFRIIFHDYIYVTAYLSSLKIAAFSTIIALLIGYPTALIISQAKESMKNLMMCAIILPFWISLIIRVYSWNIILEEHGLLNQLLLNLHLIKEPITFLNSSTAVIIGIVYCYIPFMILPIFIILEKIDKSLIEAAMDLGCTPTSAFWRVILPLSIPGVITGSLLVFIPAVGEFVVPDLLGGNNTLTIGKIIWNEFFYNKDWTIASAITITIALVFIVPVAMIQKYIIKQDE